MIKQGIIGAIMGFIMSFTMNYLIFPMPHTIFTNAAGNGMSGFMGGFKGILAYKAQVKKADSKNKEK
jgi:hypothetical protein